MGSESIAHEAEGQMGYGLRAISARGIIVSVIQLVEMIYKIFHISKKVSR